MISTKFFLQSRDSSMESGECSVPCYDPLLTSLHCIHSSISPSLVTAIWGVTKEREKHSVSFLLLLFEHVSENNKFKQIQILNY